MTLLIQSVLLFAFFLRVSGECVAKCPNSTHPNYKCPIGQFCITEEQLVINTDNLDIYPTSYKICSSNLTNFLYANDHGNNIVLYRNIIEESCLQEKLSLNGTPSFIDVIKKDGWTVNNWITKKWIKCLNQSQTCEAYSIKIWGNILYESYCASSCPTVPSNTRNEFVKGLQGRLLKFKYVVPQSPTTTTLAETENTKESSTAESQTTLTTLASTESQTEIVTSTEVPSSSEYSLIKTTETESTEEIPVFKFDKNNEADNEKDHNEVTHPPHHTEDEDNDTVSLEDAQFPWLIVGIAIGGVILLLALVLGATVYCRRGKRKKDESKLSSSSSGPKSTSNLKHTGDVQNKKNSVATSSQKSK